jgi:hypothetical protein
MTDLRVFGKTPKGAAEIAARSGGLSLAQRRLLILVDGARDVDQLMAMLPGGAEESLRTLEADGYISLVGYGTREAESLDGNAGSLSIPASAMTSVQEARRRAIRALHDLLGPAADSLAIAIEATKTGDELRPLIREAERLVASVHGAAAANTFILGIRRR